MEELPEERRAPLSRKRPTWVPAAEVRGEGLFIEFHEEALQRWLAGVVQHQHNHTFRDAHIQWRKARRREYPDTGYPGLRYVLLHSCAHALMRQLALEYGYTAASIRPSASTRSILNTNKGRWQVSCSTQPHLIVRGRWADWSGWAYLISLVAISTARWSRCSTAASDPLCAEAYLCPGPLSA